jgi:putative transposase
MIEGGLHLWNGMVYIELNMVRAGVVAHPSHWPWCSYDEWLGQRRRYGVVDINQCLRVFGGASLEEFRTNYQALIEARISKDEMAREPQWTEAIAVGSRAFVEAIGQTIGHRQQLTYAPVGEDAWALREEPILPFDQTA